MAIIRAAPQPNMIQRARSAWRIFRGIQPHRRKSAPYAFPSWRSGRVHWHLTNFQNYIDEGWTINSLIYSAIMYKIRAMTAAPLRAYGGTLDQPELLDASDPLAQLVARPNPWQSWEEHHGLNISYLNVSGNSFTYIDRKGSNGSVPAALYSMRPDRVLIVPKMDKGVATLAGYVYVPEGRSAAANWTKDDVRKAVQSNRAILLAPENVMHVKLPSPGDPLEGMGYGFSPVTPLARSGDVDNEITKFIKMFFERGGIPPFWFSYPEPMDQDEMDEQREKLAEQWGGFENWTDPGILDSGGKIERLGFTFDEMGFKGLDERNETRIMMPFGVPGVLIGSRVGLEHATYSNVEELRRMFWEDTMVPETRLFEVELQYFLQGDRGEFVAFDYGQVPALRKNVPELVESAAKMIDRGAPPDIAYQLLGLNVPEYPGSDVGHLPWNMVPLLESEPTTSTSQSQDSAASAEDDDRKSRPKGHAPQLKGRGFSDEIKDRLGRNFDNIAVQWEGRYEETAAQVFEDERRQVLASLTKAARRSQERKATVNWSEVQTDWTYFYQTEAPEVWRKAFMPLIRGVVEEQGSAWAAAFGMQFDVRNLYAEEWYDDYVMEFARGVAETTERDLAALLQQGMAEGSSIPTMRKQVQTLFTQYIDGDLKPEDFEWFTERMPKNRAEMIARTETIRASNRGSNELYRQWGVEYKQWWSHEDDRICPWCLEMHETIIPVGDAFWEQGTSMEVEVGQGDKRHSARLAFNYETVTSPPLHPNCRCALLAYNPEWEEGGIEAAPPVVDPGQVEEEAVTVHQAETLRKDVISQSEKRQQQVDAAYERREALWSDFAEVNREYLGLRMSDDLEGQQQLLARLKAEREKRHQAYLKASERYYTIRDSATANLRQMFRVEDATDFTRRMRIRKGADVARKALDEVQQWVARDAVEQVSYEVTRSKRSRSNGNKWGVNMSMGAGEKVYAHEFGHVLGSQNDDLHQKAVDFLNARTAGEDAEWLGDSYDAREVTKRDKFLDAYMGKIYTLPGGGQGGTEIVSMGIEMLYSDPVKLATKDPEYFNFIVNLLRGL